jgi:hypothetical protein
METARSSETAESLAVLYGVIIFEQHPAKIFNISIGFFPLQDNPVLLIPWMVYTVLFVIAYTVLQIINAVQYFDMGYPESGAGSIVGVIIYIRK